jgi:hypothetical protein
MPALDKTKMIWEDIKRRAILKVYVLAETLGFLPVTL